MAEKKSDVPDDRCGYTRFNNVEGSDFRDIFVKEIEPVCCWRPIWESPDEADRCIWHADVDEKPLAELITARADFPERLNWAILRNLHVESDELSLSGCTLLGATFDKSRLEEINLIDTDLRDATFTDAALPKADFAGANLQDVDFTEAFLQDVDFTNADLWNADFADAHLVGADFADAQLQYANFTGAQLAVADFTDAALPQTLPGLGGFKIALDAIEGLRRQWAVELGEHGIRVVTLKTGGITETIPEAVPGRDEIVADIEEETLLNRTATLEDVGNVASFVASDQARTLTATEVNISCGALMD